MENYQVEDIVQVIEMLLAEVDPERRDLVAEENNVDEILRILKEGLSDGSEEKGADAPVEEGNFSEGDATSADDDRPTEV